MASQQQVHVTVVSRRPRVADEEFDVIAVPRIGEMIQTQGMAAARVQDVIWHLATGKVTVYAS